ncbi:aspartate aminotransferase family protein [Pseudohongiella sp. O18]|uniref:aspartate aminotransferase family protein n=1 Tax=Pseudohongiella sp. O18 TaxID=2904248 RepID=UPI001F015B14|nr:aminotransferase class III-fold pyridoxal phosphate-dependent enzyme [Pseudohongiella sp. O18]
MNVQEVEDYYGLSVCRRQALVVERGLGVWVWDQDGRQILDFTSGWGVTCLGHSHPVMVNTIAEQSAKVMQNPNSGFTYSPARAALMQELAKVLPEGLSKMWFANSGAEANDAALKLARKVTGRQAIVSIGGAFHGRTLATLSASGGSDNAARYLPRLPDHRFAELNNIEELEQLIDGSVAAVIVELVQGEGGVRPLTSDYINALQEKCKQHGCLLIVDEVQTGFCRTGHFFACDRFALTPDMMTLGKGIAGGLPFAALVMRPEIAARVQLGDHGGTYCGNPLVSAVAAAVVKYLREEQVSRRVARLSERALADLKRLKQQYPDLIQEVRGEGLLLALELTASVDVWTFSEQCLDQGLLVTPTRNGVVRLIPSLLITNDEWQQGVGLLELALGNLWAQGQWASMRSA